MRLTRACRRLSPIFVTSCIRENGIGVQILPGISVSSASTIDSQKEAGCQTGTEPISGLIECRIAAILKANHDLGTISLQTPYIDSDLDDMAVLSERLAGCLSVREARFLAVAAATMPTSLGEVLEIGSFKGKSTTLLAKSVALVGGDRVYAVDPLFAASETVPPIESWREPARRFQGDNRVQWRAAHRQISPDGIAEAR